VDNPTYNDYRGAVMIAIDELTEILPENPSARVRNTIEGRLSLNLRRNALACTIETLEHLKDKMPDCKPALDGDYCRWERESDGFFKSSDNWKTGCGEIFSIIDGTPKDSGFKHCCYCGRPLKEMMEEGTDGY
jgi:hypothetical protein